MFTGWYEESSIYCQCRRYREIVVFELASLSVWLHLDQNQVIGRPRQFEFLCSTNFYHLSGAIDRKSQRTESMVCTVNTKYDCWNGIRRQETAQFSSHFSSDWRSIRVNLLSSSGRIMERVPSIFPLNREIGWPFGGSFHFCPMLCWQSSW